MVSSSLMFPCKLMIRESDMQSLQRCIGDIHALCRRDMKGDWHVISKCGATLKKVQSEWLKNLDVFLHHHIFLALILSSLVTNSAKLHLIHYLITLGHTVSVWISD